MEIKEEDKPADDIEACGNHGEDSHMQSGEIEEMATEVDQGNELVDEWAAEATMMAWYGFVSYTQLTLRWNRE